jgi:prefoldin alpha subunit
MADDDKIQQKYLQFKYLQQQLHQLQEYLETLQQQHQELETSISGISDLETVAPNTELLAPIANGIFVKGKLQDAKNVIVNVGANITVEKTIPEVIALLQQQVSELQEKIPMAQAVVRELAQQAKKIQEELEKEVKEK